MRAICLYFLAIFTISILFEEFKFVILILGVFLFIYLWKNGWFKDEKKLFVYQNKKVINNKNTPYFRDIPCNGNLFYADALINLNEFSDKRLNILGAIILKWIFLGKIRYVEGTSDVIDLSLNPSFDIPVEKELFDAMRKASFDGILEVKEFEKWCLDNHIDFVSMLVRIKNIEIDKLKAKEHIIINDNGYFMDDFIYEESKKLYGLKRYLLDFSLVDIKEINDVHLLEEYIIFAYLFGISDKVLGKLRGMYSSLGVHPIFEKDFDSPLFNFIDNVAYKIDALSDEK